MLKLTLCLTTALLIAVLLLQLRQQRLELSHQTNQLHNQIENRQARLWQQQLQIAVYTAPNAISQTVGEHALNLVAPTPQPAGLTHWIDALNDPGRE